MLIISLVSLFVLFIYLSIKLDHSYMVNQVVCVYPSCMKLHSLYETLFSNILVFLLKILGAYLKGYDFAVLRPRYKVLFEEPADVLDGEEAVGAVQQHVGPDQVVVGLAC